MFFQKDLSYKKKYRSHKLPPTPSKKKKMYIIMCDLKKKKISMPICQILSEIKLVAATVEDGWMNE